MASKKIAADQPLEPEQVPQSLAGAPKSSAHPRIRPLKDRSSFKEIDNVAGKVFKKKKFARGDEVLSIEEMNSIGELMHKITSASFIEKFAEKSLDGTFRHLDDVHISLMGDSITVSSRLLGIEDISIDDINVAPRKNYYVGGNYIEVDNDIYFVRDLSPVAIQIYLLRDSHLLRRIKKKDRPKIPFPRSDLPRWAEENRSKKAVTLRLPPDLIDRVDESADKLGIDRNAWITIAIHNNLKPS